MIKIKEDKKVLITSALPYIHGIPHLGNLVGSVLPADVYHRHLLLRGFNVIYICGSDAHGTSYEIEAMKQDKTPEEIINEYHEKVQEIFDKFDIDFTFYGSTHTEENKEIVDRIFKKLDENGHLEEKETLQAYSEEDGMFLFDRLVEGKCPKCSGLARGDQCNDCGEILKVEEIVEPRSTVTGKPVGLKHTKNLYLKLPEFEKWLNKEFPKKTWTNFAKNETENLLNQGLESRRITGDHKWGFSVPKDGYEDKNFYVWFDAPIGYIGITKQWDDKEWEDWWLSPEDVKYIQFMGKDNVFFHSILFPSMLKGTGEDWKQVDDIVASGWLLSRDAKFSKSTGTGLTSEAALDIRDSDYWRYVLMSLYPDKKDTEFSLREFKRKINDELNDIIGNFIHRTLTFTHDNYGGKIPKGKLDDKDKKILDKLEETKNKVADLFDEYEIKEALKEIVRFAGDANAYLNDKEPWNDDNPESTIYVSVNLANSLSILLYPFMPETSQKVWNNLEVLDQTWAQIGLYLEEGHKISKSKPLFSKIDEDEFKEIEERVLPKKEEKEMVSIEDFQKLDLRVAKIVKAEKVENADRLLKLQVSAGDETKQIVSGIADAYETEELEGKSVIVIWNLKPAKLRGVTSEGMLLATQEEDKPVLVTPEKPVTEGAEVL